MDKNKFGLFNSQMMGDLQAEQVRDLSSNKSLLQQHEASKIGMKGIKGAAAPKSSFLGMEGQTWGNIGSALSGIGSIGNIYLGHKSLGLMKDQLGLQKEQWRETQKELQHMRAQRTKGNSHYGGSY